MTEHEVPGTEMNDRLHRLPPLPEDLARALRELPRERADPGFTGRVLSRLDARSTRWFPGLSPASAVGAAAAAAAGVALVAGFALSGSVRERTATREKAARYQTLDAERARLADELAEIRRLSREPLPVVYLGGDEDVDLVIDPWNHEFTNDDPERIDR